MYLFVFLPAALAVLPRALRLPKVNIFEALNASSCYQTIQAETQGAWQDCGFISAVFEQNNDNVTLVETLIQTYCQGNCSTRVAAAFQRINETCSGLLDANTRRELGLINFVTSAVCTKNPGGKYCVSELTKLPTYKDNPQLVTTAVLDSVCGTCASLLWSVAVRVGTPELVADSGLLGLACLKAPGEGYCFPIVQQLPPPNTDPATLTPAQLDKTCSRCVRLYIRRAAFLFRLSNDTAHVNEMAGADTLLDKVCVRNSQTYCLPAVIAQKPAFDTLPSQCATLFSGNSQCSNNCRGVVTSLQANLSCCLGTFVDVYLPNNAAIVRNLLNSVCNITIGSPCGLTRYSFPLAISGLVADWVEKNPDKVKAVVAAALSYLLGESSEQFDVKKLAKSARHYQTLGSATSTDLQVEFSSSFMSSAVLVSSLNEATTGASPVYFDFPPEALAADSGAAIVGGGSTATTVPPTTGTSKSAGSVVSISFLAFVFAIVFA